MTRAKQIRVLLLLMLLTPLVYAFSMPSNPAPKWNRPLTIAIIPYNSDGSIEAAQRIARLNLSDFRPIERYLTAQARNYALALKQPFRIELLPAIDKAPGLPPQGGGLAGVRWAVGLRWWHWRLDTGDMQPDIVVIARYQAGADGQFHLQSIGMASPRLALVSLAPEQDLHPRNLVVLTHEILHTVGANDLYAFPTGFPTWPEGYVEPDRTPRYPQPSAELMAGRIPISDAIAREVRNLEETRIGPSTAREIGWAPR